MSRTLKRIFFFYLIYFKIHANLAKTKCRNFRIDEMETLHYRSAKWGQMQVQIAADHFNEGSSGQIFIGYVGKNGVSDENVPKDKCVAIKIYEVENESDYLNGVDILTKLKQYDENNEHIVNMMDNGVIEPEQFVSGFLCIMELGDMSLDQELQRGKSHRSKEELKSVIKNVMNILVLLHNVAVHLDFKAQNLLLFAKKNFLFDLFMFDAGFTLKLTDFDGSALLDGDHKRVKVYHPVLTPLYSAPELLQQRKFKKASKVGGLLTSASKMIKGMIMNPQKPRAKYVTTKMDIWSAGITIYEIIIPNFLFGTNQGEFKKNLDDKLGCIGELYRFAKLYENPDSDPTEMIVKQDLENASFEPGSPPWWERYSGVIVNILDMWGHKYAMPEIAHLLVNMMDVDPDIRMSAKGIIDYLDGKCRPQLIKVVLFSNVSADQLHEWLVDKEISRLKLISARRRDSYYKWLKKIEKKLAIAKERQEVFLQQLADRIEICDATC